MIRVVLIFFLFPSISFGERSYSELIQSCNKEHVSVVRSASAVLSAKSKLRHTIYMKFIQEATVSESEDVARLAEAYHILLEDLSKVSGDAFLNAYYCAEFYGGGIAEISDLVEIEVSPVLKLKSEGVLFNTEPEFEIELRFVNSSHQSPLVGRSIERLASEASKDVCLEIEKEIEAVSTEEILEVLSYLNFEFN